MIQLAYHGKRFITFLRLTDTFVWRDIYSIRIWSSMLDSLKRVFESDCKERCVAGSGYRVGVEDC